MPRRIPTRLVLAAAVCWMAAGAARSAESAKPAPAPPADAALDALLNERGDAAAFERATTAARRHGVPEQVLLEARFLYHVDRREDDALAQLAPRFLAARDKFQPEASAVFAVREDWLAVIEFVQALAALQQDDHDAFKRHITEAFWLSPRQGAAYAPYIERLQIQQAMRDVRVDFTTELAPLAGGEPVALERLLADRKALVLHFWSPWSRECEELAADFAAATRELDRHAVAVASLVVEDDPEAIAEARKFVAAHAEQLPAHWMRDRNTRSLHAALRVRSVPVMVVVARDGRVHFNGHPADPACWSAVRKLVPEFQRPALEEAPAR